MLTTIKSFVRRAISYVRSIFKPAAEAVEKIVDAVYVPAQKQLQSWFTKALPDNTVGKFIGEISSYFVVAFVGGFTCGVIGSIFSPVLGVPALILDTICYLWLVDKRRREEYRDLAVSTLTTVAA